MPVPADGLLVVDKPAGWTSHDVVAVVRGVAGTRRVGHAGTLDPMATGILVLGVNRATRLLTYLVGCDKSYTATIRLGQSTITDDAEGEATSVADASQLTVADVDAAVASLTGEIEQVPSSVSAIKVAGKRSYARVRAGEDVELAARRVTVSRFEVLARRPVAPTATIDGPAFLDLDVVVDVSSGTYIRALARDLGAILGVGGHLTALRRTRVGRFGLDQAIPLADLQALGPRRPAASEEHVRGEPAPGIPLVSLADAARATFGVWELTADEALAVGHGQRIRSRRPSHHPGDAAAPVRDAQDTVDAATKAGAGDGSHQGGEDGAVVAAYAPDGRLVALLDESTQLARAKVVFAPS